MGPHTALGTRHASSLGVRVRKYLCGSALRAAALSLSLLGATDAVAAVWTCHGAKPGHPTAEERVSFIREVSELAVKAEKEHGVPASALAAIAIAESSYGWARPALGTAPMNAASAHRAMAIVQTTAKRGNSDAIYRIVAQDDTSYRSLPIGRAFGS